ncbi:hypothetical protein like AT1G80130 [Hibiscus trionum]|uniref:Tetratricopeptide repeat-like superfamily protein n=1 Tax=Hibiscus trionum TaxID=183268 RepID=A0A9W7H8V1_HIBTR|nr:hypothetical protein like AT1G80130 [Hibiscus trionum]
MLLRSSSTPILNSWFPNSRDCPISSPEPDFRVLQRTSSVSFHSPSSIDDHKLIRPRNMGKAIIPAPHSLDKQARQGCDRERELESEPESCSIRRQLFSSSGLGETVVDGEDSGLVMQTLIMGGGGGDGDGKIGGGGAGSGFFESSSHGSDSTDVYYQKMIEANPGNPLLLGNYAKFLKEIRGDLDRAEEYCSRAILANPNDGSFLSLYADLIWHNQKDIQRAKSYFDQAVKTSPNDCYVLASYAHFLWDVEDEDEDGEEDEGRVEETEHSYIPPPTEFFLGPPQHSSITAAS